jgi:O-antigen/teichoic acid export membrane protein
MNRSIKNVFKNFSFTFFANVISTAISTLVIAIIPKVIGVAEYGYYQLYVFYASYTGFFHFGWCDGIYLKYGGMEYQDFDRPLMSSQFWCSTVLEAAISLILVQVVGCLAVPIDKAFVLKLTALSIVFVIPKTMLSYLLQISNRIKEYSLIVILEKLICFIVTILLLVVGNQSYQLLILADITGKIMAFLLGVYYCKDIVFCKMSRMSVALKEAWNNISIGIKLLVSNVASMLILGIVRMAIENQWSIETFAKVSLAISISNLLMVFINSVGVVMFPILKRVSMDKLSEIYCSLRTALMVLLFAMLWCYYPMKWILAKWLPNYAESFEYMSILFPMCVYECKMSMLINTYLKALRKERQLLWVNLITVILSCVLTYICVYQIGNVRLTMVSIVILFAFRATVSEVILGKYLGACFNIENIQDILICAFFMVVSSTLPMSISSIAYLGVYVCYLIQKRAAMKELLEKLHTA